MEGSILTSTKKILGLAKEYTAFDHDICTFINSAFSNLGQLGVPFVSGLVEDDSTTWEDLIETPDILTNEAMNLIKTYIYLKVRMLFDPPSTSYLIEAMNSQIAEHEWRLNHSREMTEWTAPVSVPEEEVV